jgi:hypothetical protein
MDSDTLPPAPVAPPDSCRETKERRTSTIQSPASADLRMSASRARFRSTALRMANSATARTTSAMAMKSSTLVPRRNSHSLCTTLRAVSAALSESTSLESTSIQFRVGRMKAERNRTPATFTHVRCFRDAPFSLISMDLMVFSSPSGRSLPRRPGCHSRGATRPLQLRMRCGSALQRRCQRVSLERTL